MQFVVQTKTLYIDGDSDRTDVFEDVEGEQKLLACHAKQRNQSAAVNGLVQNARIQTMGA